MTDERKIGNVLYDYWLRVGGTNFYTSLKEDDAVLDIISTLPHDHEPREDDERICVICNQSVEF